MDDLRGHDERLRDPEVVVVVDGPFPAVDRRVFDRATRLGELVAEERRDPLEQIAAELASDARQAGDLRRRPEGLGVRPGLRRWSFGYVPA